MDFTLNFVKVPWQARDYGVVESIKYLEKNRVSSR